jgi:hypothetical protein
MQLITEIERNGCRCVALTEVSLKANHSTNVITLSLHFLKQSQHPNDAEHTDCAGCLYRMFRDVFAALHERVLHVIWEKERHSHKLQTVSPRLLGKAPA